MHMDITRIIKDRPDFPFVGHRRRDGPAEKTWKFFVTLFVWSISVLLNMLMKHPQDYAAQAAP